ncbi:TRAP transporter permease [Salicibibacter kimchii]|uniref:C4-dicarboxylate ABC transporter permease n=1 Tax=Salicibibacter kimchii TaxID=2099786 RepID=A0A345C1G6_9BACI|nr:TRAP transporter fused permease subunit [Salicibibacter kimchii]AXF57047.1 C4-dicarboxylate ABC transporter permease [Salicibibacter kimchii]
MAEESSRFRNLSGIQLRIWRSLLFLIPSLGIVYILSLYNIASISFFPEQYFAVFLALILTIVFMGVPASRSGQRVHQNKVPWYDLILASLGLFVGLYVAILYPQILTSFGIVSLERLAISVTAIILILEALRRCFGWILTTIVLAVISYGYAAPYFPGPLEGQSIPFDQLVNYLYLDTNSLFSMLSIAATIALGFIFFGQILIHFKGGDMFQDIATSLLGRFRGGSAKVSVIGSSFVGSLTGGPVSNVLLTGNVTIPLMQRTGYSKSESGAIESVASTGGVILPPVMGVAAFLMAENLGVSYAEVAIAAIVPAVLYYVSFFAQVDLTAAKRGLSGIPKAGIPKLRNVLKTAWILVPIFSVLIILLFVYRYPPANSAVYTAVFALLIFLLQRQGRKKYFKKIKDIFIDTGKTSVDIGIVLSAAGLIVGIVGVTGLGFNLTQTLSQLGEYGLFILLIASAIVAIILGMGMPAIAAYSMVAVLIAPSLIELGVNPIAAHMFVFYFSILSSFTPPIAVACFTASTIAKEDPLKISWDALKYGSVAFVIPFIFVYSPSLLLGSESGQGLLSTGATIFTTVLGSILIAVSVVGYLFHHLSISERLIGALMALLLFTPLYETVLVTQIINLLGIILSCAFLLYKWSQSQKRRIPISAGN